MCLSYFGSVTLKLPPFTEERGVTEKIKSLSLCPVRSVLALIDVIPYLTHLECPKYYF